MDQIASFDPALKQVLLEITGDALGETADETARAQIVPVLAKLADPHEDVPGLQVLTRSGSVVTGRVRAGDAVRVRSHRNVISMKASRRVYPALAASVPEINATPAALRGIAGPESSLTGRGVVIGMLDWGLDFAHDNFRLAGGGTRVLAIWDQRGGAHAASPGPFGYGREHDRASIDRALRAADPYSALGYDPADADDGHGAHGTHTTDIAAGNGRAPHSSPGVAPEADIVFVNMGDSDVDQESGSLGDSVQLVEAIHYVLRKAGDRPAVINMSLGSTGGPHDQTPLVVQALDALSLSRPNLAICVSAGNYFRSGKHVSGRLAQGERTELRLQLESGRSGIAELEVWYESSDELDCELIGPSGQVVARLEPGRDQVVRSGGQITASCFHRVLDPNNGDNQFNAFLWPVAPGGEWRVRLTARTIRESGGFHAYIERASKAVFAPEQATGSHTTGTICNGLETISVAAYDPRAADRRIGGFSSSGPSRDGRGIPVLSAPGVGIIAARSSRASGGARLRNELVSMDGTSMAAPHVTGVCALILQALGSAPASSRRIRRFLTSTARQDPPARLGDRSRYGAGRVDAAAAVRAAMEWARARGPGAAATADGRVALLNGLSAQLGDLHRELERLFAAP